MFDYDVERLRAIILKITRSNISSGAWHWLNEKLGSSETSVLNTAFSLIPRKTGKELIRVSFSEAQIIAEIKPGYAFRDWTAERLARVCLLIHLNPSDKNVYFNTVEKLFLAAEMTELMALYSALPVLAYPGMWKFRCAEGVRTNMANVLEAIMYENPYPAGHLDEKAWNQLVLKAFFTDKNVNRIYGFDHRANAELSLILSDYAHERWAAGRSVNPLLWRSTSKFINQQLREDLQKVLSSGEIREQRAAALALYNADSSDAKDLLRNHTSLVSAIENKELTWETV